MIAFLFWLAMQAQQPGVIKFWGPPNNLKVMGELNPVDVPAVKRLPNMISHTDCPPSPKGEGWCEATDNRVPVWTCSDKSRILLTAEDGKRWCHKVQP